MNNNNLRKHVPDFESNEELVSRLRKMSEEEILAELEERLESMTEFTYDGKVIDSYLLVLDELKPLDINSKINESIERLKNDLADN